MTEPQTPAAEPETAKFKGESFRLNADVSDWDTMEFLSAMRAASAGAEDAFRPDELVTVHDYAIALVHDDDRVRFRAHARTAKASIEDLLEFILGKPEVDAERPTERSSDSSDGPTATAPTSDVNSGDKDSPPSGLQLIRTRPDLAVFLDQAVPIAS